MTTHNPVAEEGIPLFLLKTRSTPNDGYEERFCTAAACLPFSPTFVPVLEHQLWDDGMTVVRNLLIKREIHAKDGSKYGGMIFTSQRAVEAFAKLVDETKGISSRSLIGIGLTGSQGAPGWPHLQDIPIYTVGPATSRALRSIPQTPPLNIFGAEMGNGEALAHYMLEHYITWYKDLDVKPPILFLVGDQRRDIIPKTLMDPKLSDSRRIQVDELVVYGTGIMESFEQDFSTILVETNGKPLRWVVVFSPTGCEAMLRALGLLDSQTGKVKEGVKSARKGTYIATIGPTTRDYLRNQFGYEPDVCAAKPSPEGIDDGIKAFMQKIREVPEGSQILTQGNTAVLSQ